MKLEVAIGTYEGFLYGFTLSLPPAGEGGTPAAVQRFGYNVRGGCLKCVALAQDGSKAGKLLVTGGTDEVIRIYDFGKRVVVGELRQHDGTVTGLNFYSSSHMLSCSDDGSICIWRTHDWTLLHILGGHKGAVTGMHVHPTGRMAISVSSDRTLRLWNLLEGRCAFIKRTKGDGQLIEWSPSGAHFAVGIHSDLFIYDAASESAADDGVVRCSHSTRLNSIAWVNDGVLVTASNDNELRFWKTDGSLVASKKLDVSTGRIKAMKYVSHDLAEEDGPPGLGVLVAATSGGLINVLSVPEHLDDISDTCEIILCHRVSGDPRFTCLTACSAAKIASAPSAKKARKRKETTVAPPPQESEEAVPQRKGKKRKGPSSNEISPSAAPIHPPRRSEQQKQGKKGKQAAPPKSGSLDLVKEEAPVKNTKKKSKQKKGKGE